MTEFNRSSTLTLGRSGSPAHGLARSNAAAPTPSTQSTQTARRAEPVLAAGEAVTASTLDSTALLRGRSHVSITHNGETYQLRATRLGKLILTK
jgi:hemin uptake protein HemP